MSTYTLQMLLHWLQGAVCCCHRGTAVPQYQGGIKLLDQTEPALESGFLYIGEAETVYSILQNGTLSKEGVCILSASAPSRPAFSTLPPQLTLIESSLPFATLYNRTHQYVYAFARWEAALGQAVYSNAGLQAMLELACGQLDATLLLLNPGFKRIAAVYSANVDDQFAREVRERGYLTYDSVRALRNDAPGITNPNEETVEFVSRETNNYIIIKPIVYQGNVAARLCMILPGPAPIPAYSDFGRILAEYIAKYMFNNQGGDYSSHDLFGSLVADIIECRLTDEEELKNRLKELNIDPYCRYHVIVVSFNESGLATIPWNYLIAKLERLFPFGNITVYKGDILILLRKTSRTSRIAVDTPRFLSLLQQYNCSAGIGNSSEHISSLPPVYHQTKAGLRIGKVMDPEKHIFYYEEYSTYHIIEMAAESARVSISSCNLLHLCNNEIVSLLLYDRAHNSNLVDVLYAYLCHGYNAAETAKHLFMHRNTMLYKLHKIESIMGSSLENPILRERLLFSYRVLEFSKRYHGIDFLALKPTPADKNTEPAREKVSGR